MAYMKMQAPEFPAGVHWLNCLPFNLKSVRGKVVILYFWSYTCFGCLLQMEEIKRIQHEFPNDVMIIGVHSPKYDREKETARIRHAILKNKFVFPVVNDAELEIWRKYSLNQWPSLVMLDPAGDIEIINGEDIVPDEIRKHIEQLLIHFSSNGLAQNEHLSILPESQMAYDEMLNYCGKVSVDRRAGRVVISDSGHNRLVITDMEGNLEEVIGGPAAGLCDGSFDQARFRNPQGTLIEGDVILLADTGNNCIRRIDLLRRLVSRVAGTGALGWETEGFGRAREKAINSPWDIVKVRGDYYITMAGLHQIWKLNLEKDHIEAFAGTGRASYCDGDVRQAAFNQPMGIATDGRSICIADSQNNAIRKIDLEGKKVDTIAGRGTYSLGDIDGTIERAKLSCPEDISRYGKNLFIADTLNDKIKILDMDTNEIKTVLSGFSEPAGISAGRDGLFVADTNTSKVKQFDIKTLSAKMFAVNGRQAEKPKKFRTVKLSRKMIRSGRIDLYFEMENLTGRKMIIKRPSRVVFAGSDLVHFDSGNKIAVNDCVFPLRLSADIDPGDGYLEMTVELYYHRKHGHMQFKNLIMYLPLTSGREGSDEIRIRFPID